jgi:hypothetical protein
LLTASLLHKIEADAYLKKEYYGLVNLDIEKLTGLINQFWRSVLTSTPYRLKRTTRSSFRALPQPYLQNWLDLFWETIDENFSGLLAEVTKTKIALHIHTFAGCLEAIPATGNKFGYPLSAW